MSKFQKKKPNHKVQKLIYQNSINVYSYQNAKSPIWNPSSNSYFYLKYSITLKTILRKYLIPVAVILWGLLLGYLIKPGSLREYDGRLIGNSGQLLADGQRVYYCDVNGDGESEEFIYYHLSDNRQPVVNQYSASGDFENVWYLNGEVLENFDFISGNYDHDSLNEIYLFSKDAQNLYLYGIIPHESNRFHPDKVKVCHFDFPDAARHIVVHPAGVIDLNGDGYGEVLFSVNSRFSPTPRRVFAYDIKHDSLLTSPELGPELVGAPVLYDINSDGKPELFLGSLNSTSQSWTGSNESALYSASIVLNSNLNYYSVPVLFKSRMSVTSTFPLHTPTQSYIVSISWPLKKGDAVRLLLMNQNGEVIKQKKLSNKSFVFDPARQNWNNILLFDRSGNVLKYNEELNLIDSFSIGTHINQLNYIDIDKDGSDELVVLKDNALTIYRNNITHPLEIGIPGLGVQKVYLSVKENQNQPNQLSIQNDNYQYLVSYYKHPYYWLIYVLYSVTVLISLLIYFLIVRWYRNHIEDLKKQEQKAMKLQIQLMKNQLDPHFLFNALNSIAFSINKDDRKTAYHTLGIFSKLMRETIVSIDDFSRSLEDELNYVKHYLLLEKFRFKEQFNYDIVLSPEVKQSIKVPKMCIFCYVESALKKGVLPRQEEGRIEIKIDSVKSKGIIVSIVDDGKYRNIMNPEAGFTPSMQLMARIVDFFNAFNRQKIKIDYLDLGTPEKPSGSRIQIIVPDTYSFSHWT